MAGHSRTTATGKARRAASGKPRRVREHLPPGEAEAAKRVKAQRGAKTVALDRISRTSDPLAKLNIAREYVRSAAAKYQVDDAAVAAAIDALLAAGDRIFTTGQPVTAAQKRTRQQHTERRRQRRAETELLLREGRASIRRQQADAGRAA